MKNPENSYPSKVLLAGEYTIILGHDALVVPFPKYHGEWTTGTIDSDIAYDLSPFFAHLKTLPECIEENVDEAIAQNWHFKSSIPIGYGLGSSGAITAAAFHAFFPAQTETNRLLNTLSQIESFFHGNSSGLDPLSSYIQKPIHISDGQIKILESFHTPSHIYLWDSGRTRKSKPLIQHFKMMMDADERFQTAVMALTKFNHRLIYEIVNGQEYGSSFKEISSLQLRFFDKMIPGDIKATWEKGLEEDAFYMKLSGAGGGGYFLVYTEDAGSLAGLTEL